MATAARKSRMELESMIQELELISNQMKRIAYGHESLRQSHKTSQLEPASFETFAVGINEDGQLGIFNDEENGGYSCTVMFKKLQSSVTFVDVVCGSIFSMGLSLHNRLYSWGYVECLGRGGLEYEPLPVEFPEPCTIIQVSCSESATMALQDNGHVWFWGFFRNEKGSKINHAKYPLRLELVQNISTISMGESHALCLSYDFVAYSFGVGEYGQLVGRTQHNYHLPSPRRLAIGSNLHIFQIFAVGFHSFWQTDVGLYGCGKNGFGELGLGHTEQISEPVIIPISSKVVQIAGGLHHIIFLDYAGNIWVTGRNSDGQCGVDQEIVLSPRKIEYLPPITMIGCGKSSNHSYAVDEAGNLWTCGEGVYGQLAHRNGKSLKYFSKAPLKRRQVKKITGGAHFSISILTPSK